LDIKHDKEQTMKARRKKYTDYDKQDLAILADTRRWLNGHGLERRYLTDQERDRRVAEYPGRFPSTAASWSGYRRRSREHPRTGQGLPTATCCGRVRPEKCQDMKTHSITALPDSDMNP
jgi:hypothetical protein